jgi:DNA (cytosine-5)-methyltransferase 1
MSGAKPFRFLSLFSGIEATSVAWKPLGWECVGVAEIEPFPCALLGHPYPDVPNLGDVTKITEQQIKQLGHIDLVVGGFPCQDLSVAGKRKGLTHADGTVTRSGLFFTGLKIFQWAQQHCGARLLLIENVPGLYSSNKGRDFGAVVEHMAGLENVPIPANGWGTEGAAVGDHGLLEWCALDAQWFGVAQRRKRVFALLDTGNWSSRPPILLESEGLRGDTPPRREAGEGIAATLEASAGASRGAGTPHSMLAPAGCWWDGGQVSQTLDAVLSKGQAMPEKNRFPAVLQPVTHSLRAEGFDGSEDGTGRGTPLTPAVAPCLTGNYGKQPDNSDTSKGPLLIPVAFSCKDHGADAGEVSPTLRAMGHSGSHANAGGQVAVAIPLQEVGKRTGVSTSDPRAGIGIGSDGDPMFTLQSTAQHGIAFDLRGREGGAMMEGPHDTANIRAAAGGSRGYLATPMAVRRITPTEAERLQGFPDGYTLVPHRGKLAADGPRYRGLGNSMAVPVMSWV